MSRKWKRRVTCFLLLVVLSFSALAIAAFTRLHFSHEDFPALARLQWSLPSETARNTPQIVGHRGSGLPSTDQNATHKNQRIGNTASAIQAAIDAGVDWIEIDIRRSRDGSLIVFHDPDVAAKTSRIEPGKVSDLSLTQLKELDVLVRPKEKILTLDEVFERFHTAERKWVFDIKEPGLETELIEWMEKRVKAEHVILFGADEVLEPYRDCDYALGYVASWRGTRWVGLLDPTEIVTRCERLKCDYLVLPIILADEELVRTACAKGLLVWVYGSDDILDWEHSARRGISGLIVDDPESAVRYFQQ